MIYTCIIVPSIERSEKKLIFKKFISHGLFLHLHIQIIIMKIEDKIVNNENNSDMYLVIYASVVVSNIKISE